MLHRISFFAVGWIFLALISVQSFAHAAPRAVATITASSGQAWLRKGGASAFSPLSRRATLYPNDVVGTGASGKASILFSDGSQVRLNANSAIQITTPGKTRGRTNLFRALSGVLWARLRPDKAAQTQYSNLAVRGTAFQLEVAETGIAILTVLDGAVEFWNEKGEVVVPAGQQSTMVPGRGPTAPVAVANPGLIVEWTLDLNRVEIRREKLPDAPASASSADVDRAWAALEKNDSPAAQNFAQQAITRDADSAAAQIALGVAFLRQSKFDDAQQSFESARQVGPQEYHYQAHAWLALLFLAQNENVRALEAAQTAAKLAPNSVLARGHLALAYFFSGQSGKAETEARRAAELDPDSVAARVALAQSLLASGDTEEAGRVAAQAAALDEGDALALYTLGLADATRRDYRHALPSLEKSTRLAPDFLPAAALLARVRIRVGNETQALRELESLAAREENSAPVQTAFGEVLYERLQYERAIERLQKAVQLDPNSALAWSQLSRVLLDANRLADAIRAAREAVRLAPTSGQYHALLGRAYEFSNLSSQAEREYRTAIALDPQNALARAFLALKQSGQDLRLGGAEIAQSFLRDPAISTELLRGGVNTEITAFAGNRDRVGGEILHRGRLSDGKIHYFGRGRYDRDDGDRAENENAANADRVGADGVLAATLVPTPGTHLFGYFSHKKVRRGLPGTVLIDPGLFDPDEASRSRQTVQLNEGALAVKRNVGSRGELWAAWRQSRLRNNLTLREFATPFQLRLNTSPSRVGDVRFDWTFNRNPARSQVLTIGYAHAKTDYGLRLEGADGTVVPGGTLIGRSLVGSAGQSRLVYMQWAQRASEKFSLVAQLRRLHADRTSQIVEAPLIFTEQLREETTLPSVVATYQANARTTLRLSASRRTFDLELSTLAPNETLIVTEPGVLPIGTPQKFDVAQFDFERHIGRRGFLKMFAFLAKAQEVEYGGEGFTGSFADPVNALPGSLPAIFPPFVRVENWRSKGVGARYEQTLSRHLFLNAGGVLRDLSNRTPSDLRRPGGGFDPAPLSGDSAPYEPKYLAFLGLDYIGARGGKINLRVRRQGAFPTYSFISDFAERFPAQTYVDLRLAREPSIHNEIFLQITNLFDKKQIEYEQFPTNRRRITAGWTRRF